MTISFIIPVYNGERYISTAIDSVLAQSSSDFELITIDDGSTDNTLSIMRAYEKTDDRIRVISRSNSGRPSIPKNDGIAAAHGEYICFLDHDDLYAPDRILNMVSALDVIERTNYSNKMNRGGNGNIPEAVAHMV